ncbi:amino acid ABC transporter permease [Celeribacter sp. SCSIO 80788]|uniref:amino acid ABC transporter permease n=1 Tax=Celeribacter sp. SCSIO 80788 TaxID=3117013 RepID=UPI003DA3C33B
MDLALMERIAPYFVEAALVTLEVAALTFVFSVLIGAIATAGRMSRLTPVRWLATAYVSVFRGTPCLVQLFLIYFGGPQLGFDLTPFTAGVVGMSLNVGAYMAEAIRGAILTVDRGQAEAARSIGFGQGRTMVYVILPQAARLMIRSIGVNTIMMVKGTSLVSAISVVELSYTAQRYIGSTFKPFEIFALAAVLYIIIVYAVSRTVEMLDRRFALR